MHARVREALGDDATMLLAFGAALDEWNGGPYSLHRDALARSDEEKVGCMKTPYHLGEESKLDLIVHQAEAQLEAQLTAAIAADQRALTFAGLLAAGMAALIGAAYSFGDRRPHLAIIAIAGGLLAAVACALWSARPTPWRMPGLAPENWIEDLEVEKDTLQSCKAATAGIYNDFISENAKQIDRAARAMRISMLLTIIALFLGLVWQVLAA